jgi:hypothetical protein
MCFKFYLLENLTFDASSERSRNFTSQATVRNIIILYTSIIERKRMLWAIMDVNRSDGVAVIYMYINVVDNAMTVAGIISFTMALDIILKISFWILSMDTRGGKDRC